MRAQQPASIYTSALSPVLRPYSQYKTSDFFDVSSWGSGNGASLYKWETTRTNRKISHRRDAAVHPHNPPSMQAPKATRDVTYRARTDLEGLYKPILLAARLSVTSRTCSPLAGEMGSGLGNYGMRKLAVMTKGTCIPCSKGANQVNKGFPKLLD